ncbi:SDR family oxidoreductase [Reyranella sp. CPCC 100927]|uniref:SDR family oxidoreductase n=1 Tax=Reyranella sp. CPCC 100927 TaxID=2599616 RepID=UPI0011B46B36|nr:SDR family oxidoreductase [Reyranella sp. CPCC 100927]TWT02028.1 SDR family oxidoreductase [Reyranella sp. CPCC 100927]
MTIRFDNRVAIVTGAGNGLGRAHALLLASRGAKVVVNDPGGARDGRGGDNAIADKVVAEIKAAGGQAVANYDSVAEQKAAANIVKTAVDAFGTVDIVVNNAGILRDKSFPNMSMDDFLFVLQVHLMGSVYVTHAAWPILRQKAYGRVVLTSSNSGLYGNFGQTNYSAAKLALVGFMNTLRLEGQKYNIMVNSLAPVAGTRMTEDLMPAEVVARMKPELVSPMVGYLCSEQCTRTGEIWAAGVGYFSRVEYREGPGVRVAGQPTIEDVAQNIDKIADLTTNTAYRTAGEESQAALAG